MKDQIPLFGDRRKGPVHLCHAPGCNKEVPPAMFACKPHWFALPKKVRDAIWREYRTGQEIDKQPSLRYMAVQRLACAHLMFKPHDEKAVLDTLPYIAEAMTFQRKAIAEGLGDPLEGLIPDHWPSPKTVVKARPRLRSIK